MWVALPLLLQEEGERCRHEDRSEGPSQDPFRERSEQLGPYENSGDPTHKGRNDNCLFEVLIAGMPQRSYRLHEGSKEHI